jgi:hypothetical protein
VRWDELEAKSRAQVTIRLAIEQPNYSLHIKLQADGPKIGTAVVEYDLKSSEVTTESSVPIPLIGILGFMVFAIIRRKSRKSSFIKSR